MRRNTQTILAGIAVTAALASAASALYIKHQNAQTAANLEELRAIHEQIRQRLTTTEDTMRTTHESISDARREVEREANP
jgi:uncharacterized protein HemX